MSVQTYLDAVDHKVAEMFRDDYRTVLNTYDHSSTPLTGLVADFLAFVTIVDDYTILELTDQYMSRWFGDFDPDNTYYTNFADNYTDFNCDRSV